MKNAQSFLARYGWILALGGGVVVYLLYPSSLPFLLFGGMMLMHLGGHGGHGHGGHGGHGGHSQDRDDQPRPGQAAHQHDPAPSPRRPGEAEAYRAGFEAQRQLEPAPAEDQPKSQPHRHRGC